MAKESLNNKSKKEMESRGYLAQVVESRIPGTFITKDLFGFADVLAFGSSEFVLLQVTSRSNLSSRRRKVLNSGAARAWVDNGGVILLHGWDKPAGSRTYRLKEEKIVGVEFFSCDACAIDDMHEDEPPKS